MKIPSDAKKILISVNSKAGRKSPVLRAEELQGRLNQQGFFAELETNLDSVSEKAEEYHKNGELRALVGVGGDGTAAELVNRTSPGLPVTLLPAGTANLIAKHLRLGPTPKKMAETIAQGHFIQLDAGRANGRIFLVMVGCGFDAHVVHQVHAHRENRHRSGAKKGAHISYFSYIKPIFKSLTNYKYPKLVVEDVNSQIKMENARWAFIFNLPRYGWGIPLVPKCVGTDGKLDYCLFNGGSCFHGIKYTVFAQCGALHRFLPDVRLGQGKSFRITSETEVPYQLDGDPGGNLPLEIETLEKRFTVVVQKSIAEKFSISKNPAL